MSDGNVYRTDAFGNNANIGIVRLISGLIEIKSNRECYERDEALSVV